MGIGYLPGGAKGATIAFVAAAAMPCVYLVCRNMD
jgi:hypothetical protein